MLDITSFIREKIFRQPKLTSIHSAGEELSEKQTTKLGYLLLYCMFGAIIMSAQWTLSIIKEIPNKPTTIPSCVESLLGAMDMGDKYSFQDNFSNYSYKGYNPCTLLSQNPEFNFTKIYTSLEPIASQINNYGDQIQDLENVKSRTNYEKTNAQNDYNTALTEKIAQEEQKAYNTSTSRKTIEDSRSKLSEIDIQVATIHTNIESLRNLHKSETLQLKEQVNSANKAYRIAYLIYKTIIAFLSLLFAIIVFIILYRIYVKQKMNNSPHTVIFSVATFAYGIVLLQVVGLFLWDIIPHKIFILLLQLFSVFTPLLYLIQFLWPVILIAVFGFLVSRIQKRLYSPENILKRFIADKKCPNCGNGVDFTKPFCPLCSHEIQYNCPHCNDLTTRGMPYCSNCGGKISDGNTVTHQSSESFDSTMKIVIDAIDISHYTGVTFIPNDGIPFTMKRANIIKLALYISHKLGKTYFEAQEIHPYIEDIRKHIESSVPKNEISRIIGRIHSWSETGGTIEFNKIK